jgi:hypothetical protein
VVLESIFFVSIYDPGFSEPGPVYVKKRNKNERGVFYPFLSLAR